MSVLINNSLLILFCAGSCRACDGLPKFGTFNWQRAREVHDWKWGNVQLTGNQLSVAVYQKERIYYALKIFALVWERQRCSVCWMPYTSEDNNWRVLSDKRGKYSKHITCCLRTVDYCIMFCWFECCGRHHYPCELSQGYCFHYDWMFKLISESMRITTDNFPMDIPPF